MKIVIIGNGISAERALTELFKSDGLDVTLIKGEEYGPYPRPRLPEFIKGGVDVSLFKKDKLSPFILKGLKVVRGAVISLDTKEKTIILKDGDEISYDKLIITSGADSNRLTIANDGLDVLSLRTIADAERIIAELERKERPVVIGAGLLGLELAAAVSIRTGGGVSVIEGADHILPKQLDEKASLFFEKLLKEKGISIIKGSYPKCYEKDAVVLSDGRRIPSDLALESVGIRPSIEFAANAGLDIARAIKINSRAETSAKDVYAAGDASEYDKLSPGLVYYALETARVAAINAKGGDAVITLSSPSASIEACGIAAYSLGDIKNAARVESKESRERYEALYISEDGILLGAIAVGSRANMMRAQKSIGEPVDLSLLDF